MKDAQTPNLTSLASSVCPLATILKTIFQISRSNIFGTARHKYAKFEKAIIHTVFYNISKFYDCSSLRLSVYRKNIFKYAGLYSSNLLNALQPNFERWFLLTFSTAAPSIKWKYLMDHNFKLKLCAFVNSRDGSAQQMYGALAFHSISCASCFKT